MPKCSNCSAPRDEGHRFCVVCGEPYEEGAEHRGDPMVGRALSGGYIVQHLAGIGGMGRVYIAEQTTLGRTVAVKVIHPHLCNDDQAAARFITEARAASRLNHPNSIAILDFGRTEDGQPYIVMEHLRGKDLATIVREQGPLGIGRAVDIVRQVLAALEEAHELAIVHRDLKPENIVLEPTRLGRDFVKVVDYGLAKIQNANRPGSLHAWGPAPIVTTPGFVCGTPDYMSPEQARGEILDGRSDLYSVGVLLYQLLTGRVPFERPHAAEVLLAHLEETPVDPCSHNPLVPRAIADVVLRAMAKKPGDRFADARELSDALAEAIERSDVAAETFVRCGSCGAMNASSQKFCGECGNPMTSTMGRKDTPSMPAPAPDQITVRVAKAIPLVGRETELAWLDARVEDARAMPCSARIVGADGMGKTRLLQTFVARREALGDSVVSIAPDPTWCEVSGYALCEAIRALAKLPADGGDEADWENADDHAVRGLRDLFKHIPDGSPELRRASYADALRWALTRRAERASGMVILTVDDMEELDGVSRHAIADVIAEPPLVRTLIVVTHATSSDPAPSLVGPGEVRFLSELAPDVVVELLGQGSRWDAEPRSPLYIDQILRWRVEQDNVPPAEIDALLRLRIERLPPDARRVLHAIAVGLDDEEALRRALAWSVDVAGAIEQLEKAGMIRGLRVAHRAVAEAALAGLPDRVRSELHARAFDVAVEREAPAEVRALHAYHAGRAFQALVLLERVAKDRGARGDLRGAILALRRGLEIARKELYRGEIDDPVTAVVLFGRKLADALAKAEAYADAEGVLREALDMADPNDETRAHMLATLAQIAHHKQNQREARGYLEEALKLARKSDARELVASLETLARSVG